MKIKEGKPNGNIKYRRPVLKDLKAMESASGDCQNGSGADYCYDGSSATHCVATGQSG